MIRLVKKDKDGKVIAQCVMDIPRTISITKKDREGNVKTEVIDHPSIFASLLDGWEENYTDVITPAPAPQSEFDIDKLKAEFANATLEEKINIIAKILRLI